MSPHISRVLHLLYLYQFRVCLSSHSLFQPRQNTKYKVNYSVSCEQSYHLATHYHCPILFVNMRIHMRSPLLRVVLSKLYVLARRDKFQSAALMSHVPRLVFHLSVKNLALVLVVYIAGYGVMPAATRGGN
jgi:hypothetical protein